MEPVYNGHPWDHAKWLLNRGGLLIEVGGALGLDFGTYSTGWYIEVTCQIRWLLAQVPLYLYNYASQ